MSDFSVIIKGEVHMTRAQFEAIAQLGAATGGAIELCSAGFGTIRVVDSNGQELLYRPDGHGERPG